MVAPARGLERDPDDMGNQAAFLLWKASDKVERVSGLSNGPVVDLRQGIAATTFYDWIKCVFADCASVFREKGDEKGARAVCEGQHARDAALARKPRDRQRNANRNRAAESGACVAGDRDRLGCN